MRRNKGVIISILFGIVCLLLSIWFMSMNGFAKIQIAKNLNCYSEEKRSSFFDVFHCPLKCWIEKNNKYTVSFENKEIFNAIKNDRGYLVKQTKNYTDEEIRDIGNSESNSNGKIEEWKKADEVQAKTIQYIEKVNSPRNYIISGLCLLCSIILISSANMWRAKTKRM